MRRVKTGRNRKTETDSIQLALLVQSLVCAKIFIWRAFLPNWLQIDICKLALHISSVICAKVQFWMQIYYQAALEIIFIYFYFYEINIHSLPLPFFPLVLNIKL